MVPAATEAYGPLLQSTQARCGLARVKNAASGPFHGIHIPACLRGDPAHALHEVEQHALHHEDATDRPHQVEGDVTLLHRCTILQIDPEGERLVEMGGYGLGQFHTGQDPIFFHQQPGGTFGIRRYGAQ